MRDRYGRFAAVEAGNAFTLAELPHSEVGSWSPRCHGAILDGYGIQTTVWHRWIAFRFRWTDAC